MSQGPRVISTVDTERAVAELGREHDALARMTGAESQRIDGLVQDVGHIKGHVKAVSSKVDDVVSGVDKLNTAMAGLVRFSVQAEHEHKTHELQRTIVAAQDIRIQALEKQVEPMVKARYDERVPSLEKQIGPLIEMRTWVIALCLGAGGLIVAKIATLLGN